MMLIDLPAPAMLDPVMDDAALVARVTALAKREREARVDFIVHLAAFDERRLYARAGFPSLFAWLTDRLHFAKASAYRRVTAARLYARVPAVAAYLREGRLSLTKLCFLKDVLAPDNCLALLEQAAAATEAEVEELARVLDPRRMTAPPPDSIRTLPLIMQSPPAPVQQQDLFAASPVTVAPTPASALSSVPAPRHQIKMTVGPEFMTVLEQVRAEMSHSQPGASLETVLLECMNTTLAARRRRSRGATDRPRTTPPAACAEPSRTIPAHVRRAVWARDDGRCTFISDEGHRCTATRRLQLHHDRPFARGGAATVANIRIMCSVHNDLAARADFGDEIMNHFTRGACL